MRWSWVLAVLCVAVRFLGEGILSVGKWVGKVLGVHRNMGAEKAGHIGQESSCVCSYVSVRRWWSPYH